MFARYLYVHLMSGWCFLYIRISLLILFGVCKCVCDDDYLQSYVTLFDFSYKICISQQREGERQLLFLSQLLLRFNSNTLENYKKVLVCFFAFAMLIQRYICWQTTHVCTYAIPLTLIYLNLC